MAMPTCSLQAQAQPSQHFSSRNQTARLSCKLLTRWHASPAKGSCSHPSRQATTPCHMFMQCQINITCLLLGFKLACMRSDHA
jgi:hypothetical protein